MTEHQGKCERCRVRWVWDGTPPLHRATCPSCGTRLQRTTHALTWPARYARGHGRPRALLVVGWERWTLLRRFDRARAELGYLAERHVREQHGGQGPSDVCPTCQIYARDRAVIAKHEQAGAGAHA